MSGGWASSIRRTELPPNWRELRAERRRIAGNRCERIKDNGQRCPNRGRDCHHEGGRDDHHVESLRWLCVDCHKTETAREAAEARQDRRRPVEEHPAARAAAARGGAPLPEPLGTGWDSNSGRIQVPSPTDLPRGALEAALEEAAAAYAGVDLSHLRRPGGQ